MKEKFTVRRSEDGIRVLHQLNNQLFCNVEAWSADKSVEDYESGTTFLM